MTDNPTSSDGTTPEGNPVSAAQVADGINTFSLEYVQQLRNEAASHRVGKNEAVEAAKAATATGYDAKIAAVEEKFTQQGATLSARELELSKLKAIIAAKIPVDRIEEIAPLVEGTDEATITARVQTLKALMGDSAPARVPAVDPSQGGSGVPVIPLNGDPIMKLLNEKLGITG